MIWHLTLITDNIQKSMRTLGRLLSSFWMIYLSSTVVIGKERAENRGAPPLCTGLDLYMGGVDKVKIGETIMAEVLEQYGEGEMEILFFPYIFLIGDKNYNITVNYPERGLSFYGRTKRLNARKVRDPDKAGVVKITCPEKGDFYAKKSKLRMDRVKIRMIDINEKFECKTWDGIGIGSNYAELVASSLFQLQGKIPEVRINTNDICFGNDFHDRWISISLNGGSSHEDKKSFKVKFIYIIFFEKGDRLLAKALSTE